MCLYGNKCYDFRFVLKQINSLRLMSTTIGDKMDASVQTSDVDFNLSTSGGMRKLNDVGVMPGINNNFSDASKEVITENIVKTTEAPQESSTVASQDIPPIPEPPVPPLPTTPEEVVLNPLDPVSLFNLFL